MTKISVVLAVYNEEENLRQCLESVADFAWEIVIVDGGSKDKTVQIAKSFGARVISADNPAVFHINKNKAIDAAKGDWILQLDADEVVTRELSQEIKKIVSRKSEINGYWIPRKNFFLGRFLKKGGQYPDYTLRLYKIGKGRLPAKDVHEQAVVEGKVGFLKNDLLHLRDKNFAIYIQRLNTYTDLIATQMKQNGVKKGFITSVDYFFIKPVWWFVKTYFRHKGFIDGFPGFVFSLFSSLRFPIAYIKLLIDKGEDK
ncbi:MAG: Glucosyl-transferase [Microgenomates group bacterium Gr01-1014_7]|nr:MAG: Glucosyl-transferase [Microgenomates group bacterium Gr01-1014_7]